MNDNQIDHLNEIKTIAQLMTITNESENINGNTIQNIGYIIIELCNAIQTNN